MNFNNDSPYKPNAKVPKKILLMGHGDGFGGAQTAFRELYKFVSSEGYLVKIISITDLPITDQPFPEEIILGHISHVSTTVSKFIKKILDLTKAGLQAWYFKPDIFISVGLNNSTNYIARFLSGQCFKISQDFIADRLVTDPMWHASRAAMNGICVQAPSMLDYWQRSGGQVTGVDWLPCFPEPPIPGVLRSTSIVPKLSIKLAYFGRLAGNKGLHLLMHSLASPSVSHKTTLAVWGQGVEEIHLRLLVAELGLDARVQFLGDYPGNEEGARLMASYDALVLCSTQMEGLPLILLEAMAYGLPFLTTNVGAIRDCCMNNPDVIMVQPTQETITEGMQLLVHRIENNDFDPCRLRKFYERTFSYEVMATRWRECLQNPSRFFYES